MIAIITILFFNISVRAQNSVFTNCFFDNSPFTELKSGSVYIDGEVERPGWMNTNGLKMYSVIVKETFLGDNNRVQFTGAYKYEGYSLKEILDPFILQKKNASEFPPLVDVFVEISNEQGDKVVVSWGEIFYPNNQNNIIIAVRVMPVIPEKTKEEWPIPSTYRLIIGNDLATVRNISEPTRIRVYSANFNLNIVKGKSPMQADEVNISVNSQKVIALTQIPESCVPLTLHTIFYGKGRGLHSTEPFTGCNMKTILENYVDINTENLKNGLVVFAADDGYRAVYSLSELCNRCDQEYSLLLFDADEQVKGKFRIFPSCDFFSDRAVKGLTDIFIYNHNF